MKFILTGIVVVFFASCGEQSTASLPAHPYDGPLRTLDNAIIKHSEEAVIKAEIKAEKLLELQNGDKEFPFGMAIEFFDEKGDITGTLRADYAYYTIEENRWKATGDVVVNNIKNKEILRSEELFWEPKEENISTDKFVRIESPEQVISGTGLQAKQDFSSWTIKKQEGTFDINEDENP